MICPRNENWKVVMRWLLPKGNERGMQSPTPRAHRSGNSRMRRNLLGSGKGLEMGNPTPTAPKKLNRQHPSRIKQQEGRIPGSRSFLPEMQPLAAQGSHSCRVYAKFRSFALWWIWFPFWYVVNHFKYAFY